MTTRHDLSNVLSCSLRRVGAILPRDQFGERGVDLLDVQLAEQEPEAGRLDARWVGMVSLTEAFDLSDDRRRRVGHESPTSAVPR